MLPIIKSETSRAGPFDLHKSLDSVISNHHRHHSTHLCCANGYEIDAESRRRISDSFDGLNNSGSFHSLLQRQRSCSQRGGTGQRERLHPEMGERKIRETEATG